MFDREDDYECKICDAPISEKQTYCAKHYQEAVAQYQEQLQKYEHDLAEWELLSPTERLALNVKRDQSLLRRYAMILALTLSLTVGITQNLGPIPAGLLTLGSCLVTWWLRPAYILIGRVARSLKGGAVYAVITLILISALLWFASDFPYPKEVMIGGGVASFIFSFWREAMGGYRSSARPMPPVKPTP